MDFNARLGSSKQVLRA